MNNLKDFKNEEILKLIKEEKIGLADFVDSGICPTCFDKNHNFILFGDKKDRILYEDNDFECFLVGNPRADGHTAISTKKHYKDMLEIDDEICRKIYVLAKRVMNAIKKGYGCESVYLCTMCDGPMNHYHVQLIPRYSFEKRGSKNFVKDRNEYIEDKDKITKIREILKK